jgi:hypothetical protein
VYLEVNKLFMGNRQPKGFILTTVKRCKNDAVLQHNTQNVDQPQPRALFPASLPLSLPSHSQPHNTRILPVSSSSLHFFNHSIKQQQQ